jgi:phosphatidate cytidylyltransferase
LNPATRERLFGYKHAFDHPVTRWMTLAIVVVLVIAPLVIVLLARLGRVGPSQRQELMRRYTSWLVIIPLMLVPILLGAAWTMAMVAVLSLLCYREYARATGLFREKMISLVVVLGIFVITFAVVDRWYTFFMALFPLTVGVIAAAAILADQPKGYIQRVALGVLGFTLFGAALGHLGYIANDRDYRPILLMVILAVEANDVFAYIAGKTLGHRKLAPNTSPNKTVGGALGALVLTTVLVAGLGHYVFAETPLDRWTQLVTLGIIVSVVGQLGDLMLSSIKRDLGIKDMGATIPGHGGLLDRFDSLILVAPAVFHYVNYIVGIGQPPEPVRIITGG